VPGTVRERLDERIGGRDDMERALGAPVIAIVPKVPGWRNRTDSRVVTISAPTSVGAEAYRAALEEWTFERVPLRWAATQNNLGTALGTSREPVAPPRAGWRPA